MVNVRIYLEIRLGCGIIVLVLRIIFLILEGIFCLMMLVILVIIILLLF